MNRCVLVKIMDTFGTTINVGMIIVMTPLLKTNVMAIVVHGYQA